MFNLSGSELIFLVLIALVVLGPDKLPEAMRKAGKAYADFKKMTTGFQNEMKSVLDEPMRELRETAELAKKSAMFDINGTTDTKPVTDTTSTKAPAGAQPPKAAPAGFTSVVPAPDAKQNVEEALARLDVKNGPVWTGAARTIPDANPVTADTPGTDAPVAPDGGSVDPAVVPAIAAAPATADHLDASVASANGEVTA